MLAQDIKVGKTYMATVDGNIVPVRVEELRITDCFAISGRGRRGRPNRLNWVVTVLEGKHDGKKMVLKSGRSFINEVEGKQRPDPILSPSDTPPSESVSPATDFCDESTEESSATDVAPPSAAEITQLAREHREDEEVGKDQPPFGRTLLRAAADTVVTPTPVAANPSIAARIAAARGGQRVRGTPINGRVPNDEQEDGIQKALELYHSTGGPRVLVQVAGAGSGKTAECLFLEQVLPGTGQYTAFSRALVDEARTKFKKAKVTSTYGLAFGAVGKHYAHRLKGERVKSWRMAQMLGIENFEVRIPGAGEPLERGSIAWDEACAKAGYGKDNPPPADFAPHADLVKRLKASFLAGQVKVAVERFCQSADPEIGSQHFGYIDNLDEVKDGKRDRTNSNRVRDYLLPFARKMWLDLCDPNGSLPFNHAVYVKIWSMGEGEDRPIIPSNYILLDEYQDTAPVFIHVLKQQTHALLVMVGDDNQRIFEFTGAVNAGDYFPDAPRTMLSQSYRFGQIIADVANTILRTLEVPTKLVMKGNPGILSRVGKLDNPKCCLFRTNAGALTRLMNAIAEGKKPHLIGKVDDIVEFCKSAVELQARPARTATHPELACFEDWKEVEEYAKSDEGRELKLMVDLIKTFTAEAIIESLRNMVSEEEADIVLCTAHKCVAPETLVETSLGIVSAATLQHIEHRWIGTADGPARFEGFVAYPTRRMLRIQTENGYELSVTDDHGVQAWTGSEYERVEAKDLKVGQFVRILLSAGFSEPDSHVPLPSAEDISTDVRAVRYNLPTKLTPDCAFLFGALVADGTVYRSGVRYTKAYQSAAVHVAGAWTSIGVRVEAQLRPEGDWAVDICSTHVAAWLKEVGGMDPNRKAIPSCIWMANSECHKAFLRGLFSDGTVGVRKGFIDVVSLTTCYPKLAFDVQYLLRRLGIVARRFPVKKDRLDWHWRVEMYSVFARKFMEDIGFPDTDRNEKGSNASVAESCGYVVPISWSEAGAARSVYTKQNARLRGYISRETLKRDLGHLQDRLRFQHERIVSITPYEGPAVCVGVPDGNRFLQNGFDGWNSKGKEWDTVYLGQDFPAAGKMSDSDRRLLYVAATRAKLTLDVSECPPFCGTYEKRNQGFGMEEVFVPGLKITYTVPMPTEEDQKNPPKPTKMESSGIGSAGLSIKEDYGRLGTTDPNKKEEVSMSVQVSYAKLRDGSWGLRAEGKIEAGQVVTVTTKAGEKRQETVGRVLWNDGKVWLATKAETTNGGSATRSTKKPGPYEHVCRNGHDPHQGPCCNGRHRGGDDCGADCCEMD